MITGAILLNPHGVMMLTSRNAAQSNVISGRFLSPSQINKKSPHQSIALDMGFLVPRLL
jgi:hypothetical protein